MNFISDFKNNEMNNKNTAINCQYDGCGELSCNDELGLNISKYLCFEHLEKYEEWKPVKEYEEKYEASTQGKIRHKSTQKIVEDSKADEKVKDNEYKMVWIKKKDDKNHKQRFIHKIVGETFLYPSLDESKKFIKHYDRKKTNNKLINLRWVNQPQSTNHSKLDLLSINKPVYKFNSNYTKKLGRFLSVKDAAEKCGLFYSYISNTCIKNQETHGGYGWKYTEDSIHMEEEKWRQFRDTNYEGSTNGRIRNMMTGILLEQLEGKGGNLYVSLYLEGKTLSFQVSRIIAEIFVENDNPPENDVIHTDNNVKNNKYNNLQWVKKECDIHFNCKSVVQLSLDGKFIAKFPSITSAGSTEIGYVCSGKRTEYKNSLWCFEKDYTPSHVESLVEKNKQNSKIPKQVGQEVKIEQLHGKTREHIRFWNSILEAEEAIGKTGIGKAIRTGNRCDKFYWKRAT